MIGLLIITPWLKATLRLSSERSGGWAWVQTEQSYCASMYLTAMRLVRSNCLDYKIVVLTWCFCCRSIGLYAVKKIAVGQSHDYLLGTLREVSHPAYLGRSFSYKPDVS